MRDLHTWAFLVFFVLIALSGVLVHSRGWRGTAHLDYGGRGGARRDLSESEAERFSMAVRRRASLTIVLALPGVLLLGWFVLDGTPAPLWAGAVAAVLLLVSVVALILLEQTAHGPAQ